VQLFQGHNVGRRRALVDQKLDLRFCRPVLLGERLCGVREEGDRFGLAFVDGQRWETVRVREGIVGVRFLSCQSRSKRRESWSF
jgi:hypothetical protein